MVSYVLLFPEKHAGNPARNRADDGQHLNKPVCRKRGFECGSPAVLQCGNRLKSPKMTTTTPFSEPHEVFTSFCSHSHQGQGQCLGLRFPSAVGSPLLQDHQRLFRTSKRDEEVSFDPLIIHQSGASRCGSQGSRRLGWQGFPLLSLSCKLFLSSCANILTSLSIQTGVN